MRQLTLIRHGSIAAKLDGHYIGRTDVPLSDSGRHQTERLATQLQQREMPAIDALWCSPARRARQSAHPLCAATECTLCIKPELHEIDFGIWEGLTFAQILEQEAHKVDQWAQFAPDFAFPQGESIAQFHQRIADIAAAVHAASYKHLAIVSHGGVLRSLICYMLDWPLRDHLKFVIERGHYATLQLDGHHAVLTGLNNHGS